VSGRDDPAGCDGCLGTQQCWICTGDGCHRCQGSGSCHVCVVSAVIVLSTPAQRLPPSSTLAVP
jgi:hypothetical protein